MIPEIDLKEQLRQAGIQVLDVCKRVKRPYGTVAGWLNGFSRLPDDAHREIVAMIEEKPKTDKRKPGGQMEAIDALQKRTAELRARLDKIKEDKSEAEKARSDAEDKKNAFSYQQGEAEAEGKPGTKEAEGIARCEEEIKKKTNLIEFLDRQEKNLESELVDAKEELAVAQRQARAAENERLFLAMLPPFLSLAKASKEYVVNCRQLGGVSYGFGRPGINAELLYQQLNGSEPLLRAVEKYLADHK